MKPIRLTAALVAATVLAACGGDAGTDGAPRAAPDPGARIYSMHCLSCHQRDGRGLGEMQPSLVAVPSVAGDPEALIAWVAFGVRPATLGERRSVVVMPQFAWLSDADLAAVLSHVRTRFGNDYGVVTPEMVAAVRAAR